MFGACNVAALACFVLCFALFPILWPVPRKFAILYVHSLPIKIRVTCATAPLLSLVPWSHARSQQENCFTCFSHASSLRLLLSEANTIRLSQMVLWFCPIPSLLGSPDGPIYVRQTSCFRTAPSLYGSLLLFDCVDPLLGDEGTSGLRIPIPFRRRQDWFLCCFGHSSDFT